MVSADLPAVLELNNEWVPEVSELDAARLERIVAMSSLALVATDDDELLGVVVVVPPGVDYDSPNYRYFDAASDDFRYVDRIIVATAAHRRGVGRALYDAVFAHALDEGATRVTCEVNVEPPNPVSFAFHERAGFREVDQQSNYGGEVVVSLMAAPLVPNP